MGIDDQEVSWRIVAAVSGNGDRFGKVRSVRLESTVGEHAPRAVDTEDGNLGLANSAHKNISRRHIGKKACSRIWTQRLTEHANASSTARRLRNAVHADGESVG